jgi:hypothetical protein
MLNSRNKSESLMIFAVIEGGKKHNIEERVVPFLPLSCHNRNAQV